MKFQSFKIIQDIQNVPAALQFCLVYNDMDKKKTGIENSIMFGVYSENFLFLDCLWGNNSNLHC